MVAAAHINSWYALTTPDRTANPALEGDVDCDVCVVGAGIAGCSTALHLAEKGYRVVLLEAERIAWGASGRSGAQAIFGVACGQKKLEKLVGLSDARAIWDITVEGLKLQRDLISNQKIDCDYIAGQIQVAQKPRQDQDLRAEFIQLQQSYNYQSVSLIERDALNTLLASERYFSGMLDTASGHLHPLKYTEGLAAAAMRAGVKIYERSGALSYTRQNKKLNVTTAAGIVRCTSLALCGNAWLGPFAPTLAKKIIGVGTYMIATESLGQNRAAALITNNAAITDMNWILDYFRRSSDHRLLFGGRVSYSGLDTVNTARATRARMLQVYPQLKDVKVEYAWGGYADITMNRAPHFGRLEPDVYFLQGFSGHGIALTGIAGKLLSEAIAGTNERFDLFANIPHRNFPGGAALRRPALMLAMLWYRLRDLL